MIKAIASLAPRNKKTGPVKKPVSVKIIFLTKMFGKNLSQVKHRNLVFSKERS